MSKWLDKEDYCIAEQLNIVCYHCTKEWCHYCQQNEQDRQRFLREIACEIPVEDIYESIF